MTTSRPSSSATAGFLRPSSEIGGLALGFRQANAAGPNRVVESGALDARDAAADLWYGTCARADLRRAAANNGAEMSKPVIFTISAAWDQEASVWSGHCDDIPAAADAPTLDELLEKMSAMALDLLPDNHPDVAPESLFLQITALREAEPVAG